MIQKQCAVEEKVVIGSFESFWLMSLCVFLRFGNFCYSEPQLAVLTSTMQQSTLVAADLI